MYFWFLHCSRDIHKTNLHHSFIALLLIATQEKACNLQLRNTHKPDLHVWYYFHGTAAKACLVTMRACSSQIKQPLEYTVRSTPLLPKLPCSPCGPWCLACVESAAGSWGQHHRLSNDGIPGTAKAKQNMHGIFLHRQRTPTELSLGKTRWQHKFTCQFQTQNPLQICSH